MGDGNKGETNGYKWVGMRRDRPDVEKGGREGGSKQECAGVHLLCDVACNGESSENSESWVGDSMEGLENTEDGLGLIAHNFLSSDLGSNGKENGNEESRPFALFNPKKALGLCRPSLFRAKGRNKINLASSCPDITHSSGESNPSSSLGAPRINTAAVPTELVQLSQAPGINLKVDLNDG